MKYDDRILSLDTEEIEVTPSDDRRLVVDAFARYRITDVVKFRQAVGVGGVRTAADRLNSVLVAQVREVLGSDQVTSNTILSSDRAVLMNRIRDRARTSAANLGVEIIDVRLKQTNLPQQNLESTFARMRAERQREAEDERARGREAAQRVSAPGRPDRGRDRVGGQPRGRDRPRRGRCRAQPDLRRGLRPGSGVLPVLPLADRLFGRALKAGNSTMVISPDSEFFDYLKTSDPERRHAGGAAGSRSGMTALALALGLVCVAEGLVLVALPGRLDALIRALAETAGR